MVADGDGKKSLPLRCLAASRCTVASVVTVLILLVVVKAIKVVHRPDSLSLGIAKGAMFMKRLKQPKVLLIGQLSLQIDNPRIRTNVYLTNIKAYCFDKNTSAWSSTPGRDSLFYFRLFDVMLRRQGRVEIFMEVHLTRGYTMDASSFDSLYNKTDSLISDVTMRLEGNLTTEIRSGFNSTPRWSTYYCWPLFFGMDPENTAQVLSLNLKDVFCREVQGRHFI